MTFAKTGRLPHIPEPTPAQQCMVQIVCGTVADFLHPLSDVERKAVVSNLVMQYGTLEQLSHDQQAALQRGRRKVPPSKKGWKAN